MASSKLLLLYCAVLGAITTLASRPGEFRSVRNGVVEERREIVYLTIISRGDSRSRRSATDEEVPLLVSLKNWTLETRTNDRLLLSANFSTLWVGSKEGDTSAGENREAGKGVLEGCEARYGFVRELESVVALTICEENEIYGLVRVGHRSFFVQPLNGGKHVLYESKNSIPFGRSAERKAEEKKKKKKKKKGKNKETESNESKLFNSMSDFDRWSDILETSDDSFFLNDQPPKRRREPRETFPFIDRNRTLPSDFTGRTNLHPYSGPAAATVNEEGDLTPRTILTLERIRDYIERVLARDGERQDLNKTREREISAKASGHESKYEGASEEEDLNVKLTEGGSSRSSSAEGMKRWKRRGEIAREGHKRAKRDLMICNTMEFYNLTGDMIDVVDEKEEGEGTNGRTGEGELDENLPFEGDSEHIGYFFDRAWERDKLPKKKSSIKEAPPRWLEIGIAADYSVVDFHGARVQQYVLALLNIVSAIYKDPSLESNMKLVIVRMIFFAEKKDGMVRKGNARRSLENVNRWNRRLLSSSEESHDVAVWLTRLDIGGPSGYAPVSGACDPARSCALNRDEGLTSAFIIAHEVAHILGLTHDGDEQAGNKCGNEAALGSVMAPMVAATFHRFHWSTCSRREFHRRADHWSCLLNRPEGDNATHLKATIQETFTMDEQCRMEFGEGYELCRSFDLPEPCSHLWCGHANSSQICKTKKGPPLEGTSCGEDKWCINGYCETVDRERFGLGPVIHNARDGGWSAWSDWGKCSRSCDTGVQFRSRKCNEPVPAYGGAPCEGKIEEFRVCRLSECAIQVDVREHQCSRLVALMGFKETSVRHNVTWLPYEPDQENLKCQLACRGKQTGEVFFSGENLIDGTPCSYGSTDICIQGKCRQMGCDNTLGSEKRQDNCGVCGGDNSSCNNVTHKFQKKLRRAVTRVAVIPRGAYNIRVDVTVLHTPALYRDSVIITIRDRKRRRNDVTSFDSHGKGQILIVEGAAFRPQKLDNTYTTWARGPIFAEIIVSLAVPMEAVKGQGTTVSVLSRYSVDQKDQSVTGERYSWLPGGWGPCSVSCGGGTRQKTLACKEESTGRIVPKKKCPLSLKPPQEIEKCNAFSCHFKWLEGPWEGCTRTCGTEGTQRRQLYCVYSSFNATLLTRENELSVFRNMVPPSRCDRSPHSERECNRTPCPGHWLFTDWSSCSQSCGRGVQSRMARCVPPRGEETLFECAGTFAPDELRFCRGSGTEGGTCWRPCRGDRSQYCALKILKKYCEVSGYRRRCCDSCNESA